MKPTSLQIYSQRDFQEADKLDRIYMSELEPDKFCLTDTEEKYYKKLIEAYQLVFEEISEANAIRLIRAQVTEFESLTSANRLLNDVQSYFGRFFNKNKNYRRAILVEKFYALGAQAEERLDW